MNKLKMPNHPPMPNKLTSLKLFLRAFESAGVNVSTCMNHTGGTTIILDNTSAKLWSASPFPRCYMVFDQNGELKRMEV